MGLNVVACGKGAAQMATQLHDSEALIPVVFGALASRAARSAALPAFAVLTSEFHGLELPEIPLLDYLRRIEKYSHCSPACFVLALVYIDRMAQTSYRFEVTAFSVHRLYITALLVATKVNEDVVYDNAHWARVAGVTLEEMNYMEAILLKALDYRTFVSFETYRVFEVALVSEVVHSRDASCAEAQLILFYSGLHPNVARNTYSAAVPCGAYNGSIWAAESSWSYATSGAHSQVMQYATHRNDDSRCQKVYLSTALERELCAQHSDRGTVLED